MELRKDVISSLNLINNPNNITDEIFRKLLDNCYASLLQKPDIHNISNLNPSKTDVIKEIYASLLTLILELARNDHNIESASHIITDELNFSQNRKDLFLKMYEKQKDRLQIQLSSIGNHYPHIIGVNWKIDYIVKQSNLDESTGPIYRIRLSTEVHDRENASKSVEYVNFTCNTQQLQDLVYKLKDCVRHIEKLALEN